MINIFSAKQESERLARGELLERPQGVNATTAPYFPKIKRKCCLKKAVRETECKGKGKPGIKNIFEYFCRQNWS